MLLSEQITYARRRARVNSSDPSDTVITQYINEGVREFAKRVDGITTECYLVITPRFDIKGNYGFKLVVNDGVNAGSYNMLWPSNSNSYLNLSPGSFAACWGIAASANLASISVSWDLNTWKYTLYDEAGSATGFEVAAPSGNMCVDYTPYIFNKTGSVSSPFTGEIPLNCSIETDLPDNFLAIESVSWKDWILHEAPWENFVSPNSLGAPSYYAIRGKKIRLLPAPDKNEMLHIVYKSTLTDLTTTTETCPLPSEYHMAPVYYAAHLLLDDMHEQDVSSQNLAKFNDEVNRYRIKVYNQNPRLQPGFFSKSPISASQIKLL